MAEILQAKYDFQRDHQTVESSNLVADPHLSVAASARALRISPTTLRRYIRDYSDHLDIVRDGRKLMVAVSSIPTFAQIRDLRASKYNREDIQQILTALPGQTTLVGITHSIEAAASAAVKDAVDAALGGLRAEIAGIKRTTQDSEIVVRQSLGNVLFLIDKFGKELQIHLSEERIASNERDLRLTENESPKQLPSKQRGGKKGLVATAVSFYRRLSNTLL